MSVLAFVNSSHRKLENLATDSVTAKTLIRLIRLRCPGWFESLLDMLIAYTKLHSNPACVVCLYPLQTAWVQGKPDILSGLIWIQTVDTLIAFVC